MLRGYPDTRRSMCFLTDFIALQNVIIRGCCQLKLCSTSVPDAKTKFRHRPVNAEPTTRSRPVIVTARRAAQNEGGALSLVCFLNASCESAKHITTSEYHYTKHSVICHQIPPFPLTKCGLGGHSHPIIPVFVSNNVSFMLVLASYGPETMPSLPPEFLYFLIVYRSQRVLALLAVVTP